jgi:hypothetical protein
MNPEKIPDKTLKLILQMMYEGLDERDFESEPFNSNTISEVEDILSPLGIKFNDEINYSFFVQLYLDNPNFETEGIKRPSLMSYEVLHDESVREWRTYTYKTVVKSYYPVDDNMLHSLRGNGDGWYDYWDGNLVYDNVDDTESMEDEIQSIKRLK